MAEEKLNIKLYTNHNRHVRRLWDADASKRNKQDSRAAAGGGECKADVGLIHGPVGPAAHAGLEGKLKMIAIK